MKTTSTPYFDMETFRNSDRKYNWTAADIPALPVEWFGSAALSKPDEMTAACLVGLYKDHHTDDQGDQHNVLLICPHCWIPREKVSEIDLGVNEYWTEPLYKNRIAYKEVINWFVKWRERKIKISQIGHDRRFYREYFHGMQEAGFNICDTPQYFYKKSEGFRYIEEKAISGDLYYFHAEPFEYCTGNVKVIEEAYDIVQFDRISNEKRIDVFEAAVFAVVRMLTAMDDEMRCKEESSELNQKIIDALENISDFGKGRIYQLIMHMAEAE